MTDWKDFKIASPYDESPDAQAAAEDELQRVIEMHDIPQQLPQERFNPAVPYAHTTTAFSDKDKILLQAIQKAIDNGWLGWRNLVNDATTIGMEAEQLVKEMKKNRADAKTLLFDHEFALSLWGDDYETRLKTMVLAPDVIQYLKDTL